MEGSRLRVLQLLQKNGTQTVDGLAEAIGLAPATVRRHLDILQRDRLVAFREVRKKTGRPEHSFYLTEGGHEALPKGYDQLLAMVVEEFSSLTADDTASRTGQQLLELVFRRLSNSVVETYAGELAGKGLDHRLATLTHHLGQANFSPEVAISDGILRIKLLNCPFRSVALQNKAVCTFDHSLISSILEVGVEQEECIHDGDQSCMYTAVVGDSGERQLVPSAPA